MACFYFLLKVAQLRTSLEKLSDDNRSANGRLGWLASADVRSPNRFFTVWSRDKINSLIIETSGELQIILLAYPYTCKSERNHDAGIIRSTLQNLYMFIFQVHVLVW